MIAVVNRKRIAESRHFRDLVRLRGHESRAKVAAWMVSCFIEISIVYAAAKVLLFHNLPVW